jgi:mercuric ion transport protein
MKAKNLGILSALTASACCVGPLLLILLGLGGLGLGAVIGKYHWVLIAAAAALLSLGWVAYLKEKNSCEKAACEMKNKGITRNILILASAAVLGFTGLNVYTYAGGDQRINAQTGTQITIPVKGMTCATCELSVNSAVKKLPGVFDVKASAKNQTALVSYDPNKTSLDKITEAINKTGYKAEKPKL